MKVYRSLAELPSPPAAGRALTLGVFDGLHLGHRKILGELQAAARHGDLAGALLLTFSPHPLALLRPDDLPRMILTDDERLAELAALGVTETLILPFSRELADTPYEEFTRDVLLGRLGMRHLSAGYDFHLGRGREGSAEMMAVLGEELGFRVSVVTPCYLSGHIISSTRIRRDLAAGRMAEVGRALGRPWRLAGHVIRGRGLGRRLSFPTANIAPPPTAKLLPPPGAYLVRVAVGDVPRFGVMNLGSAPTLKNEFSAEIHILDFAEEIYGEYLEVDVLQWLRPEQRFADSTELAAAIREDIAAAGALLAKLDGSSD